MPSAPYAHKITLANIDTPKTVIAELEALNPLLEKSELLQVSFFNRAYLIITKTIHDANDAGYFANPDLMDKLEVNFAKQYFGALNHYTKDGALPGLWRRVNEGWLHTKHPASLSLMLGASAHVNGDLPVSLRKVLAKPEQLKDDYFKINSLLMKSAPAISKSYYESSEHINYLKKSLRFLYLKPVIWVVIRWRTVAWRKLENEKS